MGTPDFASAVLAALVESRHEVTAVVTQPDKPKGRGHKMLPTPVKVYAAEYGIPVYQPERIKGGELMPILETANPDLTVVAAYGKIIPAEALNYAKYGAFNVHASLLPHLRGAAPIQRAVINGDAETGVTIMQMDAGLDTGDMLLSESTPIGEYETSGELFDRLADMGAKLLLAAIDKAERGELTPVPQGDAHTYAPPIKKDEARIDWSNSAREISKLVCGMNPAPFAYTYYKGEPIKIVAGEYTENDTGKPCGTVLGEIKNKGLEIAVSGGTYIITELRPAGKKCMRAVDYLRGHRIDSGEMFE